MNEEFIKNMVSNFKCVYCGQHFNAENADVVAHYNGLWILSVYCASCQNKYLVGAVTKESNIQEVFAELSEAEQANFSIPICSNDVLNIHAFLRNFDGDFTTLFSE